MPFFHFRQNNSGGSWDFDGDRGISVNVIIEADDANDANDRAERIGIYFDGSGDCNCCGNRWSEAWGDDGADVPSNYGDTEIKPGELFPAKDSGTWNTKWMAEGTPEGFIHYKDGRVESFWATTAERKDLDGSFGWGVNFGKNWDEALVFMVTSNGYDEEGNRKAASASGGDDMFSRWVKPSEATIQVNSDYGYLQAWFPTEEEAEEFAQRVSFVKMEIDIAIDAAIRERRTAYKSEPLLQQALNMWKV